MLICDNNNKTTILHDVQIPVPVDYFWILDMNIVDYTLAPLLIFEEIEAETVELMIEGFKFCLPAYWNILIVDEETSSLDLIQAGQAAGKDFKAFVSGPKLNKYKLSTIQATDACPCYKNVAPSLTKNQLLCHPISPDLWINVTPYDLYNKYFKDTVAADLI